MFKIGLAKRWHGTIPSVAAILILWALRAGNLSHCPRDKSAGFPGLAN